MVMQMKLACILLTATFALIGFPAIGAGLGTQPTTPNAVEQAEIIPISEGQLIVCSTYAATQTMYTLVANGQIQNLDGCWIVAAPMEVIVLHPGSQISSITYRTRVTQADVDARIAEGRTSSAEHLRNRLENDPWSPWYQSPAWAFTAWLQP
ncbi:hypothetical protein [Stappia sp.]|uniref:hypothetical protein n=1 Tax=Stappia sp. TaxID=1870903 RepID=UPI003D0C9078